jgi:uncharacterized membrane protein
MNEVFTLALAIGFVAGLRSMMAPALVAWAAHRGWINLQSTSLASMGSTAAVVIFSFLAVLELLADKLPVAPKRTAPFPLSVRIVLGAFCALCLAAAMHRSLFAAVLLGAIGGLIGAFAGYRIRKRLVRKLHARDSQIAIAEDLITLGLAILIVSSLPADAAYRGGKTAIIHIAKETETIVNA